MDDSNPYATPQSDPVPSLVSPAPRLWNPDAAGAWSLIFTPVFGSILLLKNWQAIGLDGKVKAARNWLNVSIVMLVLMIVVGMFDLMINVTISNVSFAVDESFGWYYIFIWYFAWQKPQTKYVKEQWGKDYPRKSWRKPLQIGFSCWGGFIILSACF
jgi:hypothetical protein